MISGKDLRFSYGSRLGLDGLSFCLEPNGKVVGLFGANGAGKTTLIRVFAGLINSYEGKIETAISSTPVYLPDYPILPKHLSVKGCVRLFSSLYSDFDDELALRILASLQLPLNLNVAAASKGTSEQLHLALTFSRRSNLYIIDEPLASVDPLTRDVIIDMIHEYRPPDAIVIISTHLIRGLENLFDEYVVISDGKAIAHFAPDDVDKDLEAHVKDILSASLLNN